MQKDYVPTADIPDLTRTCTSNCMLTYLFISERETGRTVALKKIRLENEDEGKGWNDAPCKCQTLSSVPETQHAPMNAPN